MRFGWSRLLGIPRGCAAVGLILIAGGGIAGAPACRASRTNKAQTEAVPLRGPQWSPEESAVYRLELASSVQTTAVAALMDVELRGEVVLQARRVDGATQLAMTLANANLKGGGDDAQAQQRALVQELKEPFVFELAGGHVTHVFAAQGRSHFALSILRTLAASLQFADQPDGATSSWKAAEVDATGEYEAEYERTAGKPAVKKRKASYQTFLVGKRTAGRFDANIMPQVVESEGEVELREESGALRLHRVFQRETIRVQLTPTSPLTSRTRLTLEYRKTRPAKTFDWDTAIAGAQRIEANEPYVPKRAEPNYDAQRIGDHTFNTALKELEAQAADPKSRDISIAKRDGSEPAAALRQKKSALREQSEVFRAMVALLRVEPKNVELAKAKVLSGSPARSALLDALSSASTPEAQAVLVGLMDDARLDRELRRTATFALIRTPRATDETIAALKGHIGRDYLHVHAIYGLGTIARRARERGEDRQANEILTTILEVLAKAETPSEKMHALRAIANSGHPSALPAVKTYLRDDAALVRAAAVDAMRLMKHPDVDSIIVGEMRRGDEHVEIAAIDALAVRESTPLLASGLAYVAEHSKSAKSRLKAVDLMGAWLPRHPGLRRSLKRVSSNDEREGVRSAASRALGELK